MTRHMLSLELTGDLDTVARLVTLLRKCRSKAEVKELHVVLDNGIVKATLLVETEELQWLISKLSTMYELQELTVLETKS